MLQHDEMEVAAAAGGGGGCCCAARAFPPLAGLDLVGSPTDIQRFMLRFRPIAPRPTPDSGGASPTKTAEDGLGVQKKNRKKRSRAAADGAEDHQSLKTRPTRPRKETKPSHKAKEASAVASSIVTTSATSSEEEVAFAGTRTGAATMPPQFPTVPDAAMAKTGGSPLHLFPTTTADLLHVPADWWERPSQAAPTSGTASRVIAPTPQRPVCSVIAVVASTAGDWDIAGDNVDDQQGPSGWLAAGCGDWGAKRMLETDERPSVVSDRSGKVTFANAAYRRMVGAADDNDKGKPATSGEMRTVLIAPPALLDKDLEAFSCRLKVRWCDAGKRSGQPEKGSVTAPCDVYRLAGGGIAWRIDIGAALSLGPMGSR